MLWFKCTLLAFSTKLTKVYKLSVTTTPCFCIGTVISRFYSQINNKMGASRETCDLFWILRLAKKYPDNKKYYYDRFWYVIKHQRKLMFEDTFLPFWCKIVGHKKYTPDSDNPKEIACKRCHRWIS